MATKTRETDVVEIEQPAAPEAETGLQVDAQPDAEQRPDAREPAEDYESKPKPAPVELTDRVRIHRRWHLHLAKLAACVGLEAIDHEVLKADKWGVTLKVTTETKDKILAFAKAQVSNPTIGFAGNGLDIEDAKSPRVIRRDADETLKWTNNLK